MLMIACLVHGDHGPTSHVSQSSSLHSIDETGFTPLALHSSSSTYVKKLLLVTIFKFTFYLDYDNQIINK